MFHQAFQIWEAQWETGESDYWLKITGVCLVNSKLDGLKFVRPVPCGMLSFDWTFGLKFALIF